jgi:Flp pilus assembly protein TadG
MNGPAAAAHMTAQARRFRDARDGGVMITFGLVLVALVGMAGLAIDYGRINKVRFALQGALDNGVLAAATRKALDKPDAEDFLDAYMKENWKFPFGSTKAIATLSDAGKNGVIGNAETTVPMTLMRVLGFKNVTVRAIAQSSFGSKPTEVALVLDTTGSMAGTKLADLQTAAKGLINAAYKDADAKDKIRFAIAPFADYVNVGTTYRKESWLSVPADYSATSTVCTTDAPLISKSGCSMQTLTGYNDGTPYTYVSEVCTSYVYGPPVTTCGPQTVDYKWYGCVGSRNYPLDARQARADASQQVPGLMNVGCNSPITRLTNDKDALFSSIDGFVAQAETYIASGLIWGWRLVSHEAPFADGVDPSSGKSARKVIVLMTDGTNTRSPDYPTHWGNDTAAANALTKELCASAKSARIDIYTIAFNVSDPASLDLMQKCASGATYFFDAKNTSDLIGSFEAIGASLSVIALTK